MMEMGATLWELKTPLGAADYYQPAMVRCSAQREGAKCSLGPVRW